METFLKLVAQDLHSKLGDDLSRVAIVFPNKRAGLFFNEHLANLSERPVWSPAYVSISELFQQLSQLKLGDSITLVCELYKIFTAETKSEEALDDFYFWGELLIGDFDDVDKNMVDAQRLFSNLQELKAIMDNYDFIDPEQEEAIKQFFQNFSIERRTVLKEKFISLWDRLGSIYSLFKSRLREMGIAYEGMLYRDVIESMDVDALDYDKFVFVGFNVLNRVEHRFFSLLHDSGKAMFYWDYDQFYTSTIAHHEAGEFIRRNLRDFPNELPEQLFNVMSGPKQVRFISSPTENGQARFLPQWVEQVMGSNHREEEEKENAVVLCNEAMLLPTLHAIPQEVEHINITMGFPLAQTPVFSFVNALLELQTGGYDERSGRYRYEAVRGVLKHPYTERCSAIAEPLERELTGKNRFYPLPSELMKDEFLKLVFTPVTGKKCLCKYIIALLKEVAALYRKENSEADIFNQLYRESLFKSYTLINRIDSLIDSGELDVRVDTLRRLITRVLSGSGIPFHGEPAIGMQIMGVLETRNLDFRNLLILSLNEGQLPKAGGDSSFIPYNLRKAFGMTTIEHKNSVYAYYFYRLIQRAENVTLMYNTSTDGMNSGEWSRFMLQFLLEWPHDVKREFLDAGQSPKSAREVVVPKSDDIIETLRNRYDMGRNAKAVTLSPSALNCYMECSLRFYYRYVARLSAPDDVSSEIDSALFGTIFHRSAELVYGDLGAHGAEIREEDLKRLYEDERRLQDYVDRAFKEEFFKVPLDERPEYNGVQLINSKVICSYLKQLLRNDMHYAPFSMVATEKHVSEEMTVATDNGDWRVSIGGIIDRMDLKDDTLRIVDYKTGGSPIAATSVESLFVPAEKRPGYIFQTFLYAAIMSRRQSYKVAPSLLYIHKAASDSYSPVIEMGEPRKKAPVNNFAFVEDEFRSRLDELLREIFSPDKPFAQTEIQEKCAYCDFRSLCQR
jgi:CRISPR/Cas system-associated exonuclease Cas4 (RecB family)